MGDPAGRPPWTVRADALRATPRDPRAVVVRALLDRPDERSMGLLPIALARGDRLLVSGLAAGTQALDEVGLERLINEGHALAVRAPIASGRPGPLCAAWVGQDFERAAEDAGAPPPPFERSAMSRVAGKGWYLLDTPAVVFAALDRWVRETFAVAIDRGSHELATLLAWVSPNRDETRAAQFITGTPEQRERALAWWARLERDAGREVDEASLLGRIDAVCDRIFLDWHPARSLAPADVGSPWHAVAIGTRCAQRLAPAVDPDPGDPASPVARALRIAREAALKGRPADPREVEATRLGLLEEVHRKWQDARRSAHMQPHALHAVESALYGAERAREDTHLDQSVLAMLGGVAEIIYPDLIWRPLPALWSHFASLPSRAIDADRAWLAVHGSDEVVSPAFFDRDLWPDGAPVAWEDHISRFRDSIFGEPHPRA